MNFFCIFCNFSVLPSKYVIFPIKKKFLKRNDSRTAVIFQALKMKCSLVICRIAINKKCHSFKLLDYLSLCPIGFHEQDWLLAMTLQKRHFCKTDIDCSMLVEEHQHFEASCVSHCMAKTFFVGQLDIMSTMISY